MVAGNVLRGVGDAHHFHTRNIDPEIAKVELTVMERATPKLRQLLGLEFANSLARDLTRGGLY